jgi:DNA polymerase-4
VRSVLGQVTPWVQVASIDEAYLDVTGSQKLFGGDDAIAHYIRSEIRRKTDLPCTVAISPNKLVSKVASDEGKPDGYLCIADGEEATFLAPLAVRKLPGAGPRTCTMLESLGVLTVGQLAKIPLPMLERTLGTQSAVALQRAARGIAGTVVTVDHTPKSISRETTFERDQLDWKHIERTLTYLTERCAYSLREVGLEARRITLKVRYGDFETKTFAKTLTEPTAIERHIFDALEELLPKGRARRARVRLIGIGLSQLRHNQHQLALFDGERTQKWERALEGVDHLRGKYGFDTLHFGKSVRPAHERIVR